MKRWLCAILSLLMLLAMVGCGSKDKEDKKSKSKEQTKSHATATTRKHTVSSKTELVDRDEETDGSDTDEDVSGDSDDENSEVSTAYMDALQARYHAYEKNGYSLWTRFHDSNNERICVDSKGNIVFTFDYDEDLRTNVNNDAFITSRDVFDNGIVHTESKLWQASTGKVLYTANALQGNYIIEMKRSSMSIHEDGYAIVAHVDESYNGVEYQFGILKADGEWAVPLTKDHPVLQTMGEEASLDAFMDMYYYGEGILFFMTENGFYFYNIEENTVAEVDSQLSGSYTKIVLKDGGPLVNGVCFEWSMLDGDCIITPDGKITLFPTNFHDKLDNSVGTRYYDAANDRLIQIGTTYHENGFSVFDSKGTIIKNIPNVDLVDTNGYNEEGLAQIVMANNEGTAYYTVMDIDGEFLFEPIKMERNHVVDISGSVVDSDDDYYNGSNCIIVDRDGNVLYMTENGEKIGYKNGIVHSTKSNQPETYVVIEE